MAHAGPELLASLLFPAPGPCVLGLKVYMSIPGQLTLLQNLKLFWLFYSAAHKTTHFTSFSLENKLIYKSKNTVSGNHFLNHIFKEIQKINYSFLFKQNFYICKTSTYMLMFSETMVASMFTKCNTFNFLSLFGINMNQSEKNSPPKQMLRC